MQGKVVVITGTTSGTGFIAARTVAKKGAHTVILNRKSERAEKALESLQKEVPDGKFEWIECDLQSFESVKNAAEELKKRFPEGIDVICNNAGVMALEDKATEDGYDVQMQTNQLSHFLLNKEIFPLLEKAAEKNGEARIVSHSSDARNFPHKHLKAKYFEKNGGNLGGNGNSMIFGGARWQRYQQTKLANMVYTQELTRRLAAAGSKVVAVCAHPGLSATELQRTTSLDGGMHPNLINRLFMTVAQSPEDGSMGILRGICFEKVHPGALYGPTVFPFPTGRAVKVSPGRLATKKAGKILWEGCENACGQFALSAL
mmetsp:Transcript_17227/g.21981  ORF Transcript_17227/g.21981 Transcript_17227/m.21981 type:complete len:316 (+) Transcript_17227:303-1250(+)